MVDGADARVGPVGFVTLLAITMVVGGQPAFYTAAAGSDGEIERPGRHSAEGSRRIAAEPNRHQPSRFGP